MITREYCPWCECDTPVEKHIESYLDLAGNINLNYWTRCLGCCNHLININKEINPDDL